MFIMLLLVLPAQGNKTQLMMHTAVTRSLIDEILVVYLHRVATNLEHLKYSGISLNMENSGNSVRTGGKIVRNKAFLFVIQIFVYNSSC